MTYLKSSGQCFVVACLFISLFLSISVSAEDVITASVDEANLTAELSNGTISMTINSKGFVDYFALNGRDVVNASARGNFYFSYNSADYHNLDPNTVRIARQTDELVEIIYTSNQGELIIEQSYILLKGVQGAYSYITLKGNASSVKLREMRVVYRVDPSLFTYAYVSEQTQGRMVSPTELTGVESIMDATYLLEDGSIYTKYDWANYVDNDIVHGLCNDSLGIWVISNSDEYLNGGPMKQELMVHGTSKTPLILKMLQGEHFGASSQNYTYGDQKIYGPFFIYPNKGTSREAVIADAVSVADAEQEKWPYSWMDHKYYDLERATVTGKLKFNNGISPQNMMLVLAQPGADIYDQGKDYIFWGKSDSIGNFTLPNVRKGDYSLYVFATEGEMIEQLEFEDITINDSQVDLGILACETIKYDNLLWQIGEADRTARGFNLSMINRSFGLWDEVPANLLYDISSSKPEKDWYYAQTQTGSWTVQFENDKNYSGNAHLTFGVAGAAGKPKMTVYVNGSNIYNLTYGNDGSVYRSANQGGRYQNKIITFPASKLKVGTNTVTFKLTSVDNRGGLMYDAIKLETGDVVTSNEISKIVETDCQIIPNPVFDKAKIKFKASDSQDANIHIFDQNGRIVRCFAGLKCVKGVNTVDLNMSDLPSGIYLLKVSSEQVTYVIKLVKL